MSTTTGRSYGGKTATERDSARRRRLLDTALDQVGRQGYAATTIPRLCSSAKVSTRHFYELFSTKEDLFVDLYDEITAESYVRVNASLAATATLPLDARIPAAVVAYVHPMLEDPRVARIAFVEVMGASQRIEKLRLDYRDTLISLVAAEGAVAVERGEVADRDWRFAALALVGAVTATAYDWVVRRDRISRDAFEAQLVELAVTLLAR